MSDKPTIQEALASVAAEVGAIEKGRRSDQGYMFRGIDEALAAFHDPFARHGIVVMPEVLERYAEVRVTAKGANLNVTHLRVRFTFHGPAGDSLTCTTQGEAQDSGDKSTNKAMSAAFKYALFFVFCVPTNDPDADETNVPAVAHDPTKAVKAQLWAAAQAKGLTVEELQDEYRVWSSGKDLGAADLETLNRFHAAFAAVAHA